MGIRLVLADDHPIVLQGLQQLFARHQDFDVVSCCLDGASALEAVDRFDPDVLVMDLRMPGMSGLDVLRALSERQHRCRCLMLTATVRDDELSEATRLGVKGVVLKEASPNVLVDSVRRVHRGEDWIGPEAALHGFEAGGDRDGAPRGMGDTLTPREVEIVRMVAQGLRNKAIADRLSISEGTVKVHLHNVYEKLGVDGRLELVLCAQQRGLV
jgi:DNA-binding NarL/FixJ family response regulator